MRITPLDVRKQEFKKVVRGLDPEEVYAFLATVADEYETVLTDNRQLRDRVLELDDKVSEYRNMEKTLRDTLMTAERVMSEARDNARKEAELILRDARVQAQQNSQNTALQAEALNAQLRELRSHRDTFLARLRGLAEAQIGMVDSFVKDADEDDRHLDLGPARPSRRSQVVEASGIPEAPAPAVAPEPSPTQSFTPEPSPTQSFTPEPSPTQSFAPDPIHAPREEYAPAEPATPWDPEGPTRSYPDPTEQDQWRRYHAGSNAGESEGGVGELAETVAQMANQAGAQSGHIEQSVPSSPDSGDEAPAAPAAELPEEEPAAVASAEESEPSQEGSRWSISRFTRGLGDF